MAEREVVGKGAEQMLVESGRGDAAEAALALVWKLLLLCPWQKKRCELEVPASGRVGVALKQELGFDQER